LFQGRFGCVAMLTCWPLCVTGFEPRQSEARRGACRLALVQQVRTSPAPRRWLGACSTATWARRACRAVLGQARGPWTRCRAETGVWHGVRPSAGPWWASTR